MFVPFLIAGLVLVIFGHAWFAFAVTLGWIMLLVAAVTVLLLGGMAAIAKKTGLLR